MTILLIDDDPVMNLIHQRVIELELPHTPIQVFETGPQALRYVQQHTAQRYMIFLDLNLPVMSGWDFIDAFEQRHQDANYTIFILSSSIDKTEMKKITAHDRIYSFIQKPLKREIIRDLFDHCET